MIEVIVNDEALTLVDSCTVESLIQHLSIKDKNRVAVAVNDQVVVRSNWNKHRLSQRDRVMMFAPIQGG